MKSPIFEFLLLSFPDSKIALQTLQKIIASVIENAPSESDKIEVYAEEENQLTVT